MSGFRSRPPPGAVRAAPDGRAGVRAGLLVLGPCVLVACGGGGEAPDPTAPPPAGAGDLRVTVETGGPNQDPDGYVVTLDGARTERIATDGAIVFRDVSPGDHEVALGDLSETCYPAGILSRLVAVSPGEETEAGFRVACMGLPRDLSLVFASRRGVVLPDIYGARSDGTGLVNLTNHPVADMDPALSPDGERLAFVSERDGDPEIYVVDAAGTGLTRLTHHAGADLAPAWSPDGSRIAFQRADELVRQFADSDLFVMDADGGNVTRLTSGPVRDRWPSWSPDGTRIVFERDLLGDDVGIFVLELASGNVRRIDQAPSISREPSWSPDGQWIVFRRLIREEDSGYDIWRMRSDGTEARKIVQLPGPQLNPTWTADGRILFNGDGEVFLADVDESSLVQLTEGASVVNVVRWRSGASSP